MRIESLHIEGFGHFADQSFGPFDKPVTVLLGYNESGKSTLLEFIRTVLFGFPDRNRALHFPPLKGGRHGGRVTLRANDGICYQVERFEDARGQALSVTSSDGRISTDGKLLESLLADCKKPMFEAVFALGLSDLQNLNQLNGIEASAQIYAAGMGAANLPKAIKKIEAAQDALFKRGGSNQEAAILMKKLEDNQLLLNAAANDAVRYAELTRRRAELDGTIREADAEVEGITVALGNVARLEQARDDWATLRETDERLRELAPPLDFPEDGLAQLVRLESTIAETELARQEAISVLEVSRKRTETAIPGAALIHQKDAIEELRRQRGAFDASVGDLPKRQQELAAQEGELLRAMGELGPDWDEARVRELETSALIRGDLEAWRRVLDAAEDAVHDAAGARERAAEAYAVASESESAARAALDVLPRPTLDAAGCEAARASLELCRAKLADYQRVVDRRVNAEAISGRHVSPALEPSRQWRRAAQVFVASAVLTGVAGAALGGSALFLGIAMAVLLGAVAAGALLLGRKAPKAIDLARISPEDYLGSLAAEEQSALEELTDAAKPFGVAVPSAADLETVAVNLARAEQSLREFGEAQRLSLAATERLVAEGVRMATAETALEESETSLKALRADWGAWLAERSLSETLEPAAVSTLIERVQTVRVHMKSANDFRHRIAAIQADIQAFRELVRPLAHGHGIEADFDNDADVANAADRLDRELADALMATTRREGDLRAMEAAEAALAGLNSRLTAAGEQLNELLVSGKAADADEFRRNARDRALHDQLTTARREAEGRLRKLAGDEEKYAELLGQLAGTDFHSLAIERGRLVSERTEAEHRRGKLREQSGKAAGELERLADDARTSELRVEQGILAEELRDVAKRWATLTVARTLLEKAQRKFEEERQPDVLRSAEEFFRTVTNGRYQRLISPLGTRTITAIAADGSSKSAGQLSRGTEDQLYLALRFGLIREFGQRAAYLPVVVDDLLVNFDPDRAQRAAAAFAELSRTNQVIVFTSQPSTVEMFRNASLAVQVIDMAKKPIPVR